MVLAPRCIWFLIVFAIHVTCHSKLNLPRVLLPLFKGFDTNFTLEVTENGCYKWTLSRLDVVQLHLLDENKANGCSTRVLLSTISKEFSRNTAIVLAEDVETGETLRCDVIVDVVSSLRIASKTRQLYIEEPPEIFEVRAYDEQGNEFSTLENVEFSWSISSGVHADSILKNDVIRLINFKDSVYEIPSTIRVLDALGRKGHIILLEGVKTGTANVSVVLNQNEYKHVLPATVQLNVVANLIIEPSDIFMLPGDVVNYKLLQVKNGRFVTIPLPSTQYHLRVEDTSVAHEIRPWFVEASVVGVTHVSLLDRNSDDGAAYLPSVTLHVATPAYVQLTLLPHRNWLTVIYEQHAVAAELYNSQNHKLYIGPYVELKISMDAKFKVSDRSKNGSYVEGYARDVGVIPVNVTLIGVRKDSRELLAVNRITAQADILVYPKLAIIPSEIVLPWDPIESPKLGYQLSAEGGDGLYQWSVTDPRMATITQAGTVTARSLGVTEVTLMAQKNPAISVSASLTVEPVFELSAVRGAVAAQVGEPTFVAVSLYYKDKRSRRRAFDRCRGFPFHVDVQNSDFRYDPRAHVAMKDSCTTLGIIGDKSGSSTVTISYRLSDGTVLKDSVVVSAYEQLSVVSPVSGVVTLTVGAQRRLVFSGGPTAFSNRVMVTNDIKLTRIEAVGADTVYDVTCLEIGSSDVVLKVLESSVGETDIPKISSVRVVCAHPASVALSLTDEVAEADACPLGFGARNVALCGRTVTIIVLVKDARGNVFDNASTVAATWTVYDAAAGRVLEPDGIRVSEETMQHYQTVIGNCNSGEMDVMVRITGYQETALKKANIHIENNKFQFSTVTGKIKLSFATPIVAKPDRLLLYNYPNTTGKLSISGGSGFYKVKSDGEDITKVVYTETSRSIVANPLSFGRATVAIVDRCLNADAVSVPVTVLTVTELRVTAPDKVARGQTATVQVQAYDSYGNAAPTIGLRSSYEHSVLDLVCDAATDVVTCKMSGMAVGHTNLEFSTVVVGSSVVRSKPISIQVYPPLRVLPDSITLLVGATIQLTTKGGPQSGCVIEFTTDNDVVAVDNLGIVTGKKLGRAVIHAKVVAASSAMGSRTVYSVDTTRAQVLHLNGIRAKAPLDAIRLNARMPLWVEGAQERLSAALLASVQPPIAVRWEVSSNAAKVTHPFDGTGITVLGTDKISMRLNTLRPGSIVVTVTVTVPTSVVAPGHNGVFVDSINIKIYDQLKVNNKTKQNHLLLPPNIQFQLKSNKGSNVHYKLSNGLSSAANSVISINNNGLISTSNNYGHEAIVITYFEDGYSKQTLILVVEVTPIQYMMAHVVSDLRVAFDSGTNSLPQGSKLKLFVSYHDQEGNEFERLGNELVKFDLNRFDKVSISQNTYNSDYIVVDLLQAGHTIMKLQNGKLADVLKFSVESYIRPENVKLTVGDVLCYQSPSISAHEAGCHWMTNDNSALSIDEKTGLAVAKAKKSDLVVSYRCSDDLFTMTTTEIYGLNYFQILPSGIGNITSSGKRYIIPLKLINELDEPAYASHIHAQSCSLLSEQPLLPYECEISTVGSAYDVRPLLKVYPQFNFETGHSCVIESQNVTSPMLSMMETTVELKVIWGLGKSTSVQIPFKPKFFVRSDQLRITDAEPVATLIITGTQSVLKSVKVVPSSELYVSVTAEEAGLQNKLQYRVYLNKGYFKDVCGVKDLSVYITSDTIDYSVRVPIAVDLKDDYVVPFEFTSWIRSDNSLTILIAIIVVIISYGIGVFAYRKFADKKEIEFLELTHNRSNLNVSPPHLRGDPSYSEIQMIYNNSRRRQ